MPPPCTGRHDLIRADRDFKPLQDDAHFRQLVEAVQTLERVAGTSEIDPEPYVRYLRGKLADIYGIAGVAA